MLQRVAPEKGGGDQVPVAEFVACRFGHGGNSANWWWKSGNVIRILRTNAIARAGGALEPALCGGRSLNTGELNGQHAFITGGGSGIGLACARAFLADGARVSIMGRSPDRLAKAAASLGDPGAVATYVADVGREADVRSAVAAAHDQAPLTIAVANAGTGAIAALADTTDEDWQRVLQTNLTGTFYTFKHAGVAMARAGGGAMCAISSIAAVRTHRFMHAYVVSKAGVDMLVRNTADELAAAGVRVNSVCPGLVATDISAGLFASEAVFES
jgi:NAD(P)-dependent dehydrogenase (short-subunit alcohol dehydrogenase family)